MSSFETGVTLAFLLFWVSFPFGFRLVSCRFFLGMCSHKCLALVGNFLLVLRASMLASAPSSDPPPSCFPLHPCSKRRAHLLIEHEQMLDTLALGGEAARQRVQIFC